MPERGEVMEESRIRSLEDRVERLEDRADKSDERQTKIETDQAETRIYVKQIFERIDDIKSFIQNKNSGNKEWIDLVKWIIGGTIFIIIAYIFGNGGV